MRWLVCVVMLAVAVFGGNRALADERSHQVKLIGSGNDVEFDPRTIPSDMQQGYLAMKLFCVSCHGQERMITTLRTGISPVTKHPYGEAEFSDKIIKIMRSPKSNLDRQSAKTLTEFFVYLLRKAHIQ